MTAGERFALGGIVLGCAVLGLKGLAWWLTGSAALYSDALESIVNVAASAVALVALRFAARPADDNHPYGHDKAEFFSAVIEGVMIVIAAISIFDEAWHAFLAPRTFNVPGRGLALNGAATLINAVWSWVLFRAGKRLRSATLSADARHLLSDVVTASGVALGFGLTVLTGYHRLDALIAAATGVYVLWSGASLIRRSVGGLMDMAPDAAELHRINELIAQSGTGGIEVHDLRARQAGRLTFVDFHLVVPGEMTVSESHAICDRIESRLKTDLAHLAITIHVEPEEKAKLQQANARMPFAAPGIPAAGIPVSGIGGTPAREPGAPGSGALESGPLESGPLESGPLESGALGSGASRQGDFGSGGPVPDAPVAGDQGAGDRMPVSGVKPAG